MTPHLILPLIAASVFFPISEKAKNTAFFVSNSNYRIVAVRVRWEGNGQSSGLQITRNSNGDFIGDGGVSVLASDLPTSGGNVKTAPPQEDGTTHSPALSPISDNLLLVDGQVLGLALTGFPEQQPTGLVVTVFMIPVDPPPGG